MIAVSTSTLKEKPKTHLQLVFSTKNSEKLQTLTYFDVEKLVVISLCI